MTAIGMHCGSCQHENPAGSRFCLECGSSLAAQCPQCGTQMPPSAKFCNACGTPLGTTGGPASPSPRTYAPKHLADRILPLRAAIEGEHKQVTVLLADVKGSMDLAGRLDPEQWLEILDRFFVILAEGIHRFEGTINQYTGDGVMALFGAPIAHEDHAQRACFAVLHLQEELRLYADEVRLRHGLGFGVRMGLNSGEVVVGKIGDDLRMDYTAQGSVVDLAARMEQMADPGKALLTEHVARLVEGYFRLRDLGAMGIKGTADPIHVFELESVGRMRTRFDVSRARGLWRFVGRQSEMAVLEAALEQALAGKAQVVGVVAEPGTGKSRLCHEFLERCRARGIASYEGAQGIAHGTAVPLVPVLELFRRYFGITDLDAPRTVRDKIAGRTLLLDPALSPSLPFLFDFLGVPDPAFPPVTINPEARQRQLFELTRRLTHARSAREPAIILLEDLHWFDRASDEFLAQLVESARSTRTLMILTFRPEYEATWMAASYYHRLPLLPLAPESIAELLTDALGSDPSLNRLRELVQERSGGSPFIMEEIIQSLADTGVLGGSRGAFRLVGALDPLSLPATVQNLLASRIDRLSEREKQVLQTASVIGRRFPDPVLRRVAEIPEESLTAALHVLTSAEFLYQEEIYPQAEYAFKHPMIQEVAYRSQFAERRARVHAAVARAIEEIDRDKLDERSALLAYHWERGGNPREAARWHRRAAEWVGLSNVDEGLRHWTSARQWLDSLPEAQETLAERATVRAQILSLLARLGDPDGRGESLYEEGRDLAHRSGSRPVQSLLFHSYGLARLYSGTAVEALGPLLESARLADEAGDPGLRASVRFGLSFALTIAGRPREGRSAADEGLRVAVADVGHGAGPVTSNAIPMLLSARAFAMVWTGRLQEAENDLDGMIEGARKAKQPMPAYVAHLYHVFRCDLAGDARAALAHGQGAMECVQRGTYSSMLLWTYCMWAMANVTNGEWQVAREALDHVLRVGRERHLLGVEGLALGTMARVHLGLGDPAAARELSEETIALCRRRGTRGWEIYAQLARIRALRELGGAADRARIEAALADAAHWVETTGGDGFAPLVTVERAALAGLLGDEAGRERELREAHRLFTAIGAGGHAERIANELGR